MLDSLTWGTWAQLDWLEDEVDRSTADDDTPQPRPRGRPGKSRPRSRLQDGSLLPLPGSANTSEWRRKRTSPRVVQPPGFELLLERLVSEAPAAVPAYHHAGLESPARVNWAALPEACAPLAGGMNDERARQKVQQVESLLAAACVLVEHLRASDPSQVVRVVEFCGGAGYVALPLAALYPQGVHCTVLDMKEHSLAIASRRVRDAGLRNVTVRCERLEEYDPAETPLDLGIALHACGAASDLSHQACLQQRAAYVISPCCIGKLRSSRKAGVTRRQPLALNRRAKRVGSTTLPEHLLPPAAKRQQPCDPSQLAYPRSELVRGVLNTSQWATVARAADFGHRETADYDAGQRRRRVAKSFVEHDRQLLACEAGYVTHTSIMRPRTATPKNDVLVGWPAEWGSDFWPPAEPAAPAPPSPAPALRPASEDEEAPPEANVLPPSLRTPRFHAVATGLAGVLFGDSGVS